MKFILHSICIASLTLTIFSCKNQENKKPHPEAINDTIITKPLTLDERNIPLDSANNCRDLGGIVNLDGKKIKQGLLLRCANLHTLSSNDIAKLNSFNIKTLIDFRIENEIKESPNQVINPNIKVYNLPITDGNIPQKLENNKDISNLGDLLVKANINYATDAKIIEQYRKFFQIIQDENQIPVLFHCTAGKDRTGFASAMILYALNVDEKIIFEDYLASNIYLKEHNNKIIAVLPEVKELLEVDERYLKTGIDLIKKNYGTVEKYLVEVLHVDIEKLKKLYLE